LHKKLIVFIHGLGGDPTGTWGNFSKLISEDSGLSSFTVTHYSYPTSLFRLPFSRKYPKIQTLADGLRTQINLAHSDYTDVKLVCHSLGGLIAKRYLVSEAENDRLNRVNGTIFYAVPHNGAGLAAVAGQISWRHSQLAQLCKDSDMIRTISEAWTRERIAELIDVRYVVGGLDQVVDEFSSREIWSNQHVDVVPDRGHRNVVKPNSAHDISYLALRSFLLSSNSGRPTTGHTTDKRSAEPAIDPRANLRVAMSALLRIERQGRYLLVRNMHRPEQFSPFGGVIKYTIGARTALDQLEFKPQVIDPTMEYDLRGFISYSNLEKFLKWFEEVNNRETPRNCLVRELTEELGEAGISHTNDFGELKFSRIREILEGPQIVPAENYHQFRNFDVYDLDPGIPDNQVMTDFLVQESQHNANLLWVSPAEIQKGRAYGGQVIGSHSAYLIGNRRYWDEGPSFIVPA
jgi:pimeloyl-ACP methyl ester carboxylesterase